MDEEGDHVTRHRTKRGRSSHTSEMRDSRKYRAGRFSQPEKGVRMSHPSILRSRRNLAGRKECCSALPRCQMGGKKLLTSATARGLPSSTFSSTPLFSALLSASHVTNAVDLVCNVPSGVRRRIGLPAGHGRWQKRRHGKVDASHLVGNIRVS